MAEEFLSRRVVLGGTTFYIDKMLPLDGWRVLEVIRPCLKDLLEAVDIDSLVYTDDEGGLNVDIVEFLKVSSAVPPDTLGLLMQNCHRSVSFSNAKVPSKTLIVDGTTNVNSTVLAYEDLDPYHPYEVLGRWLAVNFSASLTGILSRFGVMIQDSSLLNTPTSPPSSESSSSTNSSGSQNSEEEAQTESL